MRRFAPTAPAVLAAVLAALLVAGCEAVPGIEPGVGGDDHQPGDAYLCQGDEIPLEALDEGRPATALGEDTQAALDGGEVPPIDDLEDWTIVTESDETVMLIRELAQPDDRRAGRVNTHERLRVERFGPPDGGGEAGWHLRSFGACDLQRDLGALGEADLVLDPEAGRPGPDATEIDVLVTERACASGEPADGRVQVVDTERTEDELGLLVGVEPRSGEQTCPSNPPTPFTVSLDEPLGERTVTDASVLPPRPLDEGQP